MIQWILGITIDNILTFNEHINNLCRNGSCKLFALRTIRKYLTQDQANLLCNAFINNQLYGSFVERINI